MKCSIENIKHNQGKGYKCPRLAEVDMRSLCCSEMKPTDDINVGVDEFIAKRPCSCQNMYTI